MARLALALALILAAALSACGCPRCPKDSQEGVGVTYAKPPTGAERGALASVIQLIIAEAGPEDPAVRAFDSALSRGLVVIGRLNNSPSAPVRGYVMLLDGRIALDDAFVRVAPPDAGYLANPKTWPLIPVVYAAGRRLQGNVTWLQSVEAARPLAGRLADRVEQGGAENVLPNGTRTGDLARALGYWKESF